MSAGCPLPHHAPGRRVAVSRFDDAAAAMVVVHGTVTEHHPATGRRFCVVDVDGDPTPYVTSCAPVVPA